MDKINMMGLPKIKTAHSTHTGLLHILLPASIAIITFWVGWWVCSE